jgi:integrase
MAVGATMKRATMVSLVEEYLVMRRKLGFALEIEGQQLMRFARYADRAGHRGPLTIELAVRWALLGRDRGCVAAARRLDAVRRFAKHRWLLDARTQVPPEGLLGQSYRRRPMPHIYSDGELAALLKAASALGPSRGLRPRTYVTLLGLLAATGLRISEALRLTRGDVDLNTGVLTVVQTKFQKSRLVPLHPTTTRALRRYARARNRRYPRVSRAMAFFLTERGTSLKYWRALMTFTALRTQLGWTGPRGQRPRLHDLRHTFAVRRLIRWHRRGVDLHHRIAALSTYLGHVKVTDTYWYLTAVPELLAITGRQYERFAFDNQRGV